MRVPRKAREVAARELTRPRTLSEQQRSIDAKQPRLAVQNARLALTSVTLELRERALPGSGCNGCAGLVDAFDLTCERTGF